MSDNDGELRTLTECAAEDLDRLRELALAGFDRLPAWVQFRVHSLMWRVARFGERAARRRKRRRHLAPVLTMPSDAADT